MTLKLIPPVPPELSTVDDIYIDDILLPYQLLGAVEKEKEDVCSYLFELCNRLDSGFLQPLGITCLFDVSGGWLSGTRCRIVGLIVTALVIDITTRARANPKDGTIVIKLHRWGAIWVCSVSDKNIFAVRSRSARPAEITRRLAQRLNATLIREETADGGSTEFTFKPPA